MNAPKEGAGQSDGVFGAKGARESSDWERMVTDCFFQQKEKCRCGSWKRRSPLGSGKVARLVHACPSCFGPRGCILLLSKRDFCFGIGVIFFLKMRNRNMFLDPILNLLSKISPHSNNNLPCFSQSALLIHGFKMDVSSCLNGFVVQLVYFSANAPLPPNKTRLILGP